MADKYLPLRLRTASQIWPEISKTPQPADRWLGNYFHRHRKRFGSHDRRFLSETIYSLFRHKSFLEEWAKELGQGHDFHFLVLAAAACEQIISQEEFQPAGLILESGNLAKIYQALKSRELPASFHAKSPEEELSVKFSFPLWLIERWKKNFGLEECRHLLNILQDRPPLVIRTNLLKISREELLERLKQKGWETEKTKHSSSGIIFRERVNVFQSEEFQDGLFEIQDEGSQILCEKMQPQPGEKIWDVCAGGGGKALSLAALMQNKGRLVATDIRLKKLDELKKRARRAGAMNIFPADLNRLEESREIRQGFDKILVDAPCSGTGTLRRNPDAKWKLKEEQFQKFRGEQIGILEKAVAHLKRGGKIFYATCSLEPEENEEVFAEFLRRHPDLRPSPFLRLSPHCDGTDGFFMAVAENKREVNAGEK